MFSPVILGQVLLNGLSLSAIYILIALGFTLLFGIMRVVNFAHGAFAMLGGYALYYAYGKYQLPYIVAAPLAAAVVAGSSLILERFVFRYFYQRMFQSMIGLLGLDLALTFSVVIIWDVYERSIPAAVEGVTRVGGLIIAKDRLVIIAIAAVALAAFWLFMTRTRYGLAMRAAAEDVEIAETQGIQTKTIYLLAFLVASFMAALAARPPCRCPRYGSAPPCPFRRWRRG